MLVLLTNSDKVALVDDEWKEDVADQKWHLNTNGYVRSSEKSGFPRYEQIYLHNLIMGEKPRFEVDHISGDKLDNREANLRHVTSSQQKINMATRRDNHSGRKGVNFVHRNDLQKKWRAWITVNNYSKHLGYFATFEKACAARKKAETKLHGIYSRSA